jgi:hypothetical protein
MIAKLIGFDDEQIQEVKRGTDNVISNTISNTMGVPADDPTELK